MEEMEMEMMGGGGGGGIFGSKRFSIVRVLIQKVFVSLDPKGFRIFWIKWREIQ